MILIGPSIHIYTVLDNLNSNQWLTRIINETHQKRMSGVRRIAVHEGAEKVADVPA